MTNSDESYSENKKSEECLHPFRNERGSCCLCGEWCSVEKTDMPGRRRSKKTFAKSIKNDIKLLKRERNLEYPEEIINLADEIYSSILKNGERKRLKKPVVFYCVFQALNQTAKERNQPPVEPISIARDHGIGKSTASKTIEYYNEIIDHASSYIDPVDLIKFYCNKLKIEDLLDSITNEYLMLIKSNPSVQTKSIRSTISAIIYSYLLGIGREVNPESFPDVFSISFSTVNSASTKITHGPKRAFLLEQDIIKLYKEEEVFDLEEMCK